MPKRVTNRNWGKPMSLLTNYGEQHVCQFDKTIAKLNLSVEQFENSTALHAWVKKNYRQRYVPEFLLGLWNLQQTYDDF